MLRCRMVRSATNGLCRIAGRPSGADRRKVRFYYPDSMREFGQRPTSGFRRARQILYNRPVWGQGTVVMAEATVNDAVNENKRRFLIGATSVVGGIGAVMV